MGNDLPLVKIWFGQEAEGKLALVEILMEA